MGFYFFIDIYIFLKKALGFVYGDCLFYVSYSYRDEEGEAIMDLDDFQSDPGSPEPPQDILDDLEDLGQRERSQTPVYYTDKVGKPRKRLVKKGGSTGKESMGATELLDEDEESNFGREGSESDAKKRKKKEKRQKEKISGGISEKGTVKKLGKSEEVNEMWEWVNPEVFSFSGNWIIDG